MLALVVIGGAVCMLLIRFLVKTTSGKCRSSKTMHGATVIVTGSNTGIGFETAKDLARRGARVILACRNVDKANEARNRIIEMTGNTGVEFMQLDLSSFLSVREFADRVMRCEERLDVLVNNAGVNGPRGIVLTEDGLETQIQTNHFGPFLLTNLLLDLLKKTPGSRIVNVSSAAHLFGAKLNFGNLKPGKKLENVYGTSKLCNILFTVELSRRLEGCGVTVNCVHPGLVYTEVFRHYMLSLLINIPTYLMAKSAEEGAQTSIYLSVSEEVQSVSGEYFADCKPVTWFRSSESKDTALAAKLWEVSERLTSA